MRKKFNKAAKWTNDPFRGMYDSLTDPILLAESQRRGENEKIKQARKDDTGL